jgi:hypothetical protein
VIARGRILLVALALGGGACTHTKTTDDGKPRASENDEAKEEPKKAKPRAAADGKGSELHPGKPDAVPVATAPEALLLPGAEEKIRDRLIAGGFLDSDRKQSKTAMRDSIRRFQKEHDLPATGVADHETVKGLGLEPDEIFRQATVKE